MINIILSLQHFFLKTNKIEYFSFIFLYLFYNYNLQFFLF